MSSRQSRNRTLLALVLPLLVACGTDTPAPAPAAPVVGQAPAVPDYSADLRKADDALLAGENVAAAEILLALVGKAPDYAPAWDLLSLTFTRLGYARAAAGAGERAVVLQPGSPTARFNAGLAQMDANNAERALIHLEEAWRLNNRQPEPAYWLGAAYESLGKPEQARLAYDAGLQRFPQDPDLLRARAAITGDLNLDGKPELVQVKGSTVTVSDGGSGRELLVWTEPTVSLGDPAEAKVVDLAGKAPALAVLGRFGGTVFAWNGESLASLGPLTGHLPSYNPARRRIGTSYSSGGQFSSFAYQIRDGKLTTVYKETVTGKGTPPMPGSLVQTQSALADNPVLAFADEALYAQFRAKAGDPQAPAVSFLLPEPDGRYRLELHQAGRVLRTATAVISQAGAWQITGVNPR